MEKAKEKPPEFFKSIKTSLKSILKHTDINTKKINDVVVKAHKIVIHTLQFLKLYLLYHYDTQDYKLPIVDKVLILNIMKVVCGEKHSNKGKPPKKETVELQNKLTSFYNDYYKPTTQPEQLDYQYMSNIMLYLCEDIITMYENNIQLHYVEYVERYVNVIWRKKYIINKIRNIFTTKKERETRIRSLDKDLRRVKNDILNIEYNNTYTSKSYYHSWIKNNVVKIIPNKDKFMKQSIYYDLKCKPLDYLPSMIMMMKEIEEYGETISNVFPLRSSITPGYIRLDTITLVYLLLRKEQGKKSDFTNKGNTKKYEDKIWKFFFRTEKKVFRKTNFSFHHMISTDGVGVSILFIRDDLIGKRLPVSKKGVNKEQYIDELNNYSYLQDKKIVGIDPGKSDLIYCVDSATKDAKIFRYSQDQRRKECKIKKYNNIILGMKNNKIQGKTIIEYETELSVYNRKTLDFDKFSIYVKEKNRVNNILFDFYEKQLFRKLKFGRYINVKRNEEKMIREFKNIYGNPDEVVVCIGDWEQRKQMKYKEPTLGKGMRTIFRKNNYDVFLVDEFRSSCKCSKCDGGICEKFMPRVNPKPMKDDIRLVHGLIRCKNGCGSWNRDRNGSSNIYKIAYNAIHNLERPSYLCRTTQSNQAISTNCYKQNIHRV